MKKGYVLTLDALLSLMVVMVIYVLIMGIQSSINTTEITEFKKLHYTSEDTLQALSEKGVLDQICVQWALAQGDTSDSHFDRARNISNSYLLKMLPARIGYRLMINLDQVANDSSRLSENDSSVETHSRRLLSGYNSSLPTQGYVARVRINDTNSSYGAVFWTRDGCNWTIQRQVDSLNITINIPKTYTGTTKCNYTNASISYDNRSAVSDAVYRLLWNNETTPRDGKANLPVNASTMTTDVAVMSSVKSVSVPVKVELVLWMK